MCHRSSYSENSLNDSRPEIISEVATTLREWHAIYKEAYMVRFSIRLFEHKRD